MKKGLVHATWWLTKQVTRGTVRSESDCVNRKVFINLVFLTRISSSLWQGTPKAKCEGFLLSDPLHLTASTEKISQRQLLSHLWKDSPRSIFQPKYVRDPLRRWKNGISYVLLRGTMDM